MNRASVAIIIYFFIMAILVFLNFLPQIRHKTALKNNQIAGLFTSSILFIIFFYYFKNFISDTDNSNIIILATLYSIWFYLTKITTNRLSSQHKVLNDIF